MAVSTTDLIPRVRALLDERPYVSIGTLTSAGDLIATVTDGTAWDEGAIMEFQDNGEQCFVQSVSGNDVTVVRGWNGTTAQTHTSITVYRDPIYTYKAILQELEGAVDKLFPYCFKVDTDTITPAPTTTVWYDLNADILGLVRVSQLYGTGNKYHGAYGEEFSGRGVVYAENLPTALVTSGKGLRFPHGFFSNTNTVNVVYKRYITGTSDIEDDGKLPVAQAVIYGALENVFLGQEGLRVGQGEDAEPSRSVRAGSRSQLAAQYGALFRRELQSLRLKHEKLWPEMRVIR